MSTPGKGKWKSLDEVAREFRISANQKVAKIPYKTPPKTHTLGKRGSIATFAEVIPFIQTRALSMSTSKDSFDLTCRLSAVLEDLDPQTLAQSIVAAHAHLNLLEIVFTNKHFLSHLSIVCDSEAKTSPGYSKPKPKDLLLEDKVFLNSALSLSLFLVVLALPALNDDGVACLRRELTHHIQIFRRQSPNLTFANVCFTIERIFADPKNQYTTAHPTRFPVRLTDTFLFSTLQIARVVAGVVFLSLTIYDVLGEQFKLASDGLDRERANLSRLLSRIYGAAALVSEKVIDYLGIVDAGKRHGLDTFFKMFTKRNEQNLLFFIKKICAGFQQQGNTSFHDIMLRKISAAPAILDEVRSFGHTNLAAFTQDISEDYDEWSNKVFAITTKTLSLLAETELATDSRWKVSIAVHELRLWLREVHEVINKFLIDDEWTRLSEFVKMEGSGVEWKSSFFVPTEQHFESEEKDAVLRKRLFERIARTVLAMMNTDGGVILVGLVEHPERIVRPSILKNLIYKNGLVFFDIASELEMLGKSLDQVRIELIGHLRSYTDETAEKFNNLLVLDTISLVGRGKGLPITVVKIDVKKAQHPFFTVERRNSTLWISLIKRAEGETVEVDIRQYLPK